MNVRYTLQQSRLFWSVHVTEVRTNTEVVRLASTQLWKCYVCAHTCSPELSLHD